MASIKGITVQLHVKEQIGTDPFGAPVYSETPTIEEVENVLVAPASSTDVLDNLQLYGKHAVYTIGIPKGDTHEWRDAVVEFFGQKFKTFGEPTLGIESMIPLDWNMKVQCEIYG